MEKRKAYIYTISFIFVLLIGFVCNFTNLTSSFAFGTENQTYEAWSILTENNYNRNMSFKYQIIDFNGLIHKILGQHEMNGAVKLNNGKIAIVTEKTEIPTKAQKILDLNDFLIQQEISFAYIQTPYEICAYDSQLPKGISDYSNQNADEMLGILEEKGMSVLDLRKALHEDGMNHYDCYFKTDHHWTIETAFWASGKITTYLGQLCDFETDASYYSIDDYDKKILPNCFLGSNGRKTGRWYAGLDDLTILIPTFETDMLFEVKSKGISRSGNFEEAMLDQTKLEGDNLFEMSQYDIYTGGNYDCTHQENRLPKIDQKILIIRDSYSRPVQAFMGTVFAEIDTIDLRYYSDSTYEYIEEMSPDAVIIIYNPYMLLDENAFNFQGQEENTEEQ